MALIDPRTLLAAFAISGCVLAAQTGSSHEVTAVRRWMVGDTTRVAVEVSGDFEYHSGRLHNPERIYFDISKAAPRIDSARTYSKEFEGSLVNRIRVAETAPGVTRVVLDLREPMEVSTSKLSNPSRLLIELRQGPAAHSISPSLADPSVPPQSAKAGRASPGSMAGPTLKLSPASAAPGTAASLVMSLSSPSGEEPASLQWELSYPSPQLGMEDGDLAISTEARLAGKSLTCTGRAESAGIFIYRCVMAGGTGRIPSGPVALLAFRVRAYARPGPASVRLSNVLCVLADGTQAGMEPSQTEVVIQ